MDHVVAGLRGYAEVRCPFGDGSCPLAKEGEDCKCALAECDVLSADDGVAILCRLAGLGVEDACALGNRNDGIDVEVAMLGFDALIAFRLLCDGLLDGRVWEIVVGGCVLDVEFECAWFRDVEVYVGGFAEIAGEAVFVEVGPVELLALCGEVRPQAALF